MLHVSALPLAYGRHSYDVSVGAVPNLTYMSMSPVPPLVTNLRLVAPDGTFITHVIELPVVAAWLVAGTPFCRISADGGGGVAPCVLASSPRNARPSLENLTLLAAELPMFASVSLA